MFYSVFLHLFETETDKLPAPSSRPQIPAMARSQKNQFRWVAGTQIAKPSALPPRAYNSKKLELGAGARQVGHGCLGIWVS